MRPTIGMKVKLYGGMATIVAVHKLGTIDVELNGKHYRITGLNFI